MKTISFFEYTKQKEVTTFPIKHKIGDKIFEPIGFRGNFKIINS